MSVTQAWLAALLLYSGKGAMSSLPLYSMAVATALRCDWGADGGLSGTRIFSWAFASPTWGSAAEWRLHAVPLVG